MQSSKTRRRVVARPGRLSKRNGRPLRKPRPQVSRWSNDVTRNSRALELEEGVFTWDDPKAIARSLKESAEMSHQRKAGPFQSAMSMLSFFINRAGRNLPERRRRVLERTKAELRKVFGRR